jgi:hypothetical protein
MERGRRTDEDEQRRPRQIPIRANLSEPTDRAKQGDINRAFIPTMYHQRGDHISGFVASMLYQPNNIGIKSYDRLPNGQLIRSGGSGSVQNGADRVQRVWNRTKGVFSSPGGIVTEVRNIFGGKYRAESRQRREDRSKGWQHGGKIPAFFLGGRFGTRLDYHMHKDRMWRLYGPDSDKQQEQTDQPPQPAPKPDDWEKSQGGQTPIGDGSRSVDVDAARQAGLNDAIDKFGVPGKKIPLRERAARAAAASEGLRAHIQQQLDKQREDWIAGRLAKTGTYSPDDPNARYVSADEVMDELFGTRPQSAPDADTDRGSWSERMSQRWGPRMGKWKENIKDNFGIGSRDGQEAATNGQAEPEPTTVYFKPKATAPGDIGSRNGNGEAPDMGCIKDPDSSLDGAPPRTIDAQQGADGVWTFEPPSGSASTNGHSQAQEGTTITMETDEGSTPIFGNNGSTNGRSHDDDRQQETYSRDDDR